MSIEPADTTISDPNRIVFAIRNPQAGARLYYDARLSLARDPRLNTAFTVIPGSEFEPAARDFLRARGVVPIPWSNVKADPPHLIIAGGPARELFEVDAPFMALTHGAGNNRLRTDLQGVYGLSPDQLLPSPGTVPAHRGGIPDWLPLAGQAAMDRLARDCPEALPAAEIFGDLCLERMLLSGDRATRRLYRKALGVKPGQRFILISSTWGGQSLIGSGGLFLAQRLLTSLPMDRYRVGIVPHPNIEYGRGPSMIGFLDAELANGLIMPPPHEGWRATVIASDLVIGDSGSVTQYSIASGKPVLLRAFGFDQMPADSPLAEVGRTLPWLDLHKPLEPQLLGAIEQGQHFDFGHMLATDRSPSARLLEKVYELLGIKPMEQLGPFEPQVLPEPEAVEQCRPSTAWNFSIRFGPDGAEWQRLPITAPAMASGALVAARTECRDRRLKARADLLLHHGEILRAPESREVAEALLEDWEHCSFASVRTGEGELLLAARRGERRFLEVRCDLALIDVVAAAVHAWLTQHAADPASLDAADPLVGLERCFEPPLSFVAL